jgi:hypothetical protein
MCEVKSVRSEELFPLVKELLGNGSNIRICVTGSSMVPFLRHNRDQVELCTAAFSDIHKNDIVLIKRDNGQYVLHRVNKITKSCFYLIGDAHSRPEGPVRPEQLIAKVTVIWRGNRAIHSSSTIWKLASFIWLMIYPLRPFVFKSYRVLVKLFNIKKRRYMN